MIIRIGAPPRPEAAPHLPPHSLAAAPATGRSPSGWSAYGAFRRCPRAFAFQDRKPVAEVERRCLGLAALGIERGPSGWVLADVEHRHRI